MEEGGFEARRRPGFEAMHKMRALLRSWAGGGGGGGGGDVAGIVLWLGCAGSRDGGAEL